MLNQKHTPSPYKKGSRCKLIPRVDGFDLEAILAVEIRLDTTQPGNPAIAYARKSDDAEFIVRACNSHYELLEVLKAILEDCTFEKRSGIQRNVNEYRAVAKAAIAKAEAAHD